MAAESDASDVAVARTGLVAPPEGACVAREDPNPDLDEAPAAVAFAAALETGEKQRKI